jgi:uncharacterized membrane protein YkvA (DUF1232 family)
MARTVGHAFTGASLLLDGGFRNQLRLAWRLLRDDRVTSLKFVLPALLALYVASPVDPIPDFLIGVGQIDDLGVAVVALMLLVRIMPWLAPAQVVDEHIRTMAGHGTPAERSNDPAGRAVDASFRVHG